MKESCASRWNIRRYHDHAGALQGEGLPHPSVGVLRTLVVVPYSESSDDLGLAECYIQRVRLSIGERDEPHVMVLSGDVAAIYEPERSKRKKLSTNPTLIRWGDLFVFRKNTQEHSRSSMN